MRKKILMIGNTNGLPGVAVDLNGYKAFFTSPCGGNWYQSEIDVLSSPTRSVLLQKIQELTKSNLDYLITIFTGHGGYTRKSTILELNARRETLDENELKSICGKQLLIFDCCRQRIEHFGDIMAASPTKTSAFSMDRVREKYDARIAQAINQKLTLYACSIGESAIDTNSGGIYSSTLLETTKTMSKSSNDEFLLVSAAHVLTANLVTKKFPQQHPGIVQPKCLAIQQLVFAINPDRV